MPGVRSPFFFTIFLSPFIRPLVYSLLANQLNYDLYLRFLPQHSLEMYPGLARYAVSLITLVLKKEWRFESDSFVDITDSVYRDQVVQIVKGMKRVIAPHWESVAFCICRRSRVRRIVLSFICFYYYYYSHCYVSTSHRRMWAS